jgi:hypothetical protein
MGGNNSNVLLSDNFKYGGSDLKAPDVNGTYKMTFNFAAGTAVGASGKFTLVKQ